MSGRPPEDAAGAGADVDADAQDRPDAEDLQGVEGPPETEDPPGVEDPPDAEEPPGVEDLRRDLAAIADEADSERASGEIRELEALLDRAHRRGLIDATRRRLDPGDVGQALVGSVVFATPLLVEGGIGEIAAHFTATTVAGVPVFLAANAAFVVGLTHALLEWTGRETEETHRLPGGVPARLVMVLGVAFAVSAVLMTVWGRVDWGQPATALARVSVVWTVGSLGAALGDILGEDADAVPRE